VKDVSSHCVYLLYFVFLGMWLFLQDKGSSCEASVNHPQGCYEVSCHIHEGTKTEGGALIVTISVILKHAGCTVVIFLKVQSFCLCVILLWWKR
jgi:hypothetical protein